jgi:hypothetical protein
VTAYAPEGVAYHPGFGQQVPYRFDWLPDDPDGQVAVAIHQMIDYILDDSKLGMIQERALLALTLGDGDPVLGVWNSVKPRIQFKQDAEIAAGLQLSDNRLADVVEVFIRPIDQELLIRLKGAGFEDCDGFELYAACLLTALGIRTSLVTVAADRSEPTRFSHVYLAAYIDGKRIPLDFSHGQYLGWECPNLGRIREWPVGRFSIGPCWIALGLVLVVACCHLLKMRAA